MIKLSVIIPIYKVEKYIKKCLDSVIKQSLKDIEIICIDDCGNDNSMKIVEEYAKKDNRIKVFKNKKNLGLGLARNVGIKNARGKYIAFVDADDWLKLNAFELMVNKAEKYNLEILRCGFRYIFSDYILNYNMDEICSDYDKIYCALDDPTVIIGKQVNSVWNAVYSRKFLIDNNLFFVDRLCEDQVFFLDMYIKAKRTGFIKDRLYNYNKINENSCTKSLVYLLNAYYINSDIINLLIKDKPYLHNARIYKMYERLELYSKLIPCYQFYKNVQMKYYFKNNVLKILDVTNIKELSKYIDISQIERLKHYNFISDYLYRLKLLKKAWCSK